MNEKKVSSIEQKYQVAYKDSNEQSKNELKLPGLNFTTERSNWIFSKYYRLFL